MSVTQSSLRQRVLRWHGVKPDAEHPDQFWVGGVHLVFDNEEAEEMIGSIEPRSGIRTGNFSLDVGVHNFSQAGTNRMLDVLLDLLVGGEDTVAVYLSEQIMLMQKSGKLIVHPSRLGEDSIQHLQRRRQCLFQDLGSVF